MHASEFQTIPVAVAAADEAIGGFSLVWLAFVVTASAVAFVVCGVLSARGTLHPNVLIGVRTKFTLENERNWYAVHERVAPSFTGAGLFYALGVVPLVLFDSAGPQALTMTALLIAGTAVMVVGTMRAQRAAELALDQEDDPEGEQGAR